jgi:hypothetical protein
MPLLSSGPMRRTALVLALLVAACSSATSDTSTTTSNATSTTRVTQTLVPGGLIPADPATLVPYEDAEPILVGESHHGVVSSNGRWAAVITTSTGSPSQVNVIDLETLTIIETAEGSGEGLSINDRGVAVWIEDGHLTGLGPDPDWSEIQLPGPVLPDLTETLTIGNDGRILYLLSEEDGIAPVTLVVIDGTEATSYEIPDAMAGPLADSDSQRPARSFVAPDLAWDEANGRAYVISATANEISVVDVSTGALSTHLFESAVEPGDAHQSAERDVYVNGDGTVLVIATSTLEVEDTVGGWTATEAAADLTIVDTSDWSSEAVSQSISNLKPSLDRRYVSGTGASITWSDQTEPEVLQSPIYLIEGVTGEPLVGFEGRSGTIVDTQFSADTGEMYVISENDEGTNIDIVDVAGQGLAGSLAFTRISLIGEAGLIAFHATR